MLFQIPCVGRFPYQATANQILVGRARLSQENTAPPGISVFRLQSALISDSSKPGIASELNLERSHPKTEQGSWHPALLTTVKLLAHFLA